MRWGERIILASDDLGVFIGLNVRYNLVAVESDCEGSISVAGGYNYTDRDYDWNDAEVQRAVLSHAILNPREVDFFIPFTSTPQA